MKIWMFIPKLNFVLALLVLLLFPLASLGTRMSWWNYTAAFQLLKAEVLLGLLVILIAVIFIIVAWIIHNRVHVRLSVVSLILAAIIVVPFLYQFYLVNTLPKIHDITTDWNDPPQFEAIVAIRPVDSNSLNYPGKAFAKKQRVAYPDITSIILPLTVQESFTRAEEAVKELGWQIVNAEPNQGIIEATDTSFWFGFQDDIVIRIRETLRGGSKIDVRSVSRVGLSDVGANAKRIRKFRAAFNPA